MSTGIYLLLVYLMTTAYVWGLFTKVAENDPDLKDMGENARALVTLCIALSWPVLWMWAFIDDARQVKNQ